MPGPRVDRLLTMCLFSPLRRAELGGDKFRLPILMYHSISDDKESSVSPYYRVATSPGLFAEHMALLQSDGCEVVGLKQGCELLRRPPAASRKVVVVTFDDGFRDFYTAALPTLRRHGFGATMFLPTAFIGDDRRVFKERECLTWAEARECRQAGIEFGSHTVNHPKLYELGFDEIRGELETSKAVIEDRLGGQVTSFAYPYTFPSADRMFVGRFTELLKNAGYECNVTTRIGRARTADDLFALRRLPANSADDGALFLAKIHGAYDWMTWPQDMFKKMKRLVSGARRIAPPRPCQAG